MLDTQLDHRHAGRTGIARLLDGIAMPAWVIVDQDVKSKIVWASIADAGLLSFQFRAGSSMSSSVIFFRSVLRLIPRIEAARI